MNFNFKKRAKLVSILIAIAGISAIIRLFYLQIISHKQIKNIGEKEFKRTITEINPRGRIYDSSGELLADSIMAWDLAVMKKELGNPNDLCSFISKLMLKDKNTCLKKISSAKNYVKIKKYIEMDKYKAISDFAAKNKIKGLIFEPHQKRIFPQETALEIIGIAREDRGLTGIELLYDNELKASISKKEVIKDRIGQTVFTGKEIETKKPADIYLTIDSKIQFFTEEILKKYTKDSGAKMGVAIVQEVKSGKIAALASWPTNRVNIVPFELVYEPGSTFKTITLSVALEEKVSNEKEVFYCEKGAWKFNSKVTLRDHKPEGNLNLREAFEKSSNIAFAKLGLRIGIEKMYLYIKSFGFGAICGLGFNGESPGILKDIKKYRDIDLAVNSFGHSIAVTPIQLINAYTAIANNGILLKPYVVERIKGEKEEKVFSKEEIRKVISEETAKKVINFLQGVVDNGTGINAFITGYSVAGKTGTANKLDPKTGKYMEKKNMVSFCGFFPASDPMYTILVIMDNPQKFHYGGEIAAPAFREIAKNIINLKNIKPDRDFDYKEAVKTSYSKNISD